MPLISFVNYKQQKNSLVYFELDNRMALASLEDHQNIIHQIHSGAQPHKKKQQLTCATILYFFQKQVSAVSDTGAQNTIDHQFLL